MNLVVFANILSNLVAVEEGILKHFKEKILCIFSSHLLHKDQKGFYMCVSKDIKAQNVNQRHF